MWFASGSYDSSIRVWDIETGTANWASFGHDQFVTSVAFSVGNTRIVSGSWDKTLRIWNSEAEPLQGHSDWVRYVACSWDGRFIASSSVFLNLVINPDTDKDGTRAFIYHFKPSRPKDNRGLNEVSSKRRGYLPISMITIRAPVCNITSGVARPGFIYRSSELR